MSLFKYKLSKKRLDDLESDLSKIISESDNDRLMNLFNLWQNQRNVCNELFVKYIEDEIKKHEN
jgi:hypothetical protein